MSRSLHNSMIAVRCADRIIGNPPDSDRRTLQLLYRTAYHFHAAEVEVVSRLSQGRAPTRGHAAQGRAVDFRLPEVEAETLRRLSAHRSASRCWRVHAPKNAVRASGCA